MQISSLSPTAPSNRTSAERTASSPRIDFAGLLAAAGPETNALPTIQGGTDPLKGPPPMILQRGGALPVAGEAQDTAATDTAGDETTTVQGGLETDGTIHGQPEPGVASWDGATDSDTDVTGGTGGNGAGTDTSGDNTVDFAEKPDVSPQAALARILMAQYAGLQSVAPRGQVF